MKLAIHSTHEAAKKIAGIGAVLDGILPDPAYKAAFRKTVLVGPWPFADGRHPQMKAVHFDSASVPSSPALSVQTTTTLKKIADEFGTRIVFGTRDVRGEEVDVLLARPSGIQRQKVIDFQGQVKNRFGFDMAAYTEKYCAIEYRPDDSLTRLLHAYRDLQKLKPGGPFSYPPQLPPEKPLYDNGRTFSGGVPFNQEGAVFPAIAELDSL